MTSGQMWNHIRGPPFMHRSSRGTVVIIIIYFIKDIYLKLGICYFCLTVSLFFWNLDNPDILSIFLFGIGFLISGLYTRK